MNGVTRIEGKAWNVCSQLIGRTFNLVGVRHGQWFKAISITNYVNLSIPLVMFCDSGGEYLIYLTVLDVHGTKTVFGFDGDQHLEAYVQPAVKFDSNI